LPKGNELSALWKFRTRGSTLFARSGFAVERTLTIARRVLARL
jgi:hypothetical protein